MRLPLNALYVVRRTLLKLLNVKTRGARVMLFNGRGEILLIRHAYGRTDLFLMPGGGIKPWEKPEQAAYREVKEEAGCSAAGLILVGTFDNRSEGRRDTVYLFKGTTSDEPVPDGREVEEARFFALDALPATLSDATARRIEEHLGRRPIDARW
jgi:ADP-ribose pyrophosphatase YjhB (NUDIX family)